MTKLVEERWAKARRMARLLSFVPFIRFIGVTGSMARGTASEKSDIDFFIVAKKGRLFLTRGLTVLLLSLIGEYRTRDRVTGKICTNCWATDNHLTVGPKNEYVARDYSRMLPLYDPTSLYPRFLVSNSWFRRFLKHQSKVTDVSQVRDYGKTVRNIGEWVFKGWIGNVFERWAKGYQTRRIKRDPRTHTDPGRVFVSDTELRFHPPKTLDRTPAIR
jgi:predicted nucleotidyltransferase